MGKKFKGNNKIPVKRISPDQDLKDMDMMLF